MKRLQLISFIFISNFSVGFLLDFDDCKPTDTNFEKCLKAKAEEVLQSAYKARPNIGLPCLDPLVIAQKIQNSRGKKYVDYVQEYEYFHFWGLRDAKITDLILNQKNKLVRVDVLLTHLTGEFTYNFQGNLFSKPIDSRGMGYMDFVNTRFKLLFKYAKVQHDQHREHLKVNVQNFTIGADAVFFYFKSESNQTHADYISKMYNDRWQEYFDDVDFYSHFWTSLFENLVNGVLNKVPLV